MHSRNVSTIALITAILCTLYGGNGTILPQTPFKVPHEVYISCRTRLKRCQWSLVGFNFFVTPETAKLSTLTALVLRLDILPNLASTRYVWRFYRISRYLSLTLCGSFLRPRLLFHLNTFQQKTSEHFKHSYFSDWHVMYSNTHAITVEAPLDYVVVMHVLP